MKKKWFLLCILITILLIVYSFCSTIFIFDVATAKQLKNKVLFQSVVTGMKLYAESYACFPNTLSVLALDANNIKWIDGDINAYGKPLFLRTSFNGVTTTLVSMIGDDNFKNNEDLRVDMEIQCIEGKLNIINVLASPKAGELTVKGTEK